MTRVPLFIAPFMLFVSAIAQAETSQAQALLRAMAEAYHQLEYRGRFIYAHGADISTMEVSHAVIDGREYERLTHLDGQLAELIRTGEEIVCIHPDQTLTRLPRGSGLGPLDLRERIARVPQQYNVLIDGEDRVAGRDTLRVRLAPLDSHRHGYRLWLDQESALLLKSEMVDDSGRALERVEFVSLELSPGLTRDDFTVPAAVRERVLESIDEQDHPVGRLRLSSGWLPNGFSIAERDLRQPDARRQPIVAKSYTDGLAAFSVFVEPVVGADREEGVTRMGPTVAVSRNLRLEANDYRVTLVGEVPLPTAERIIAGMELSNADD